ncbi:MAG TPA: hypothetical protein VIH52_02355 [Candidatus Nanoarchaeia archaeon]|nr:hypothetical protein [uncultured archaeon]
MESLNERVINIGSLEKRPSGLSVFLSLSFVLLVVVGVGFGLGLLYGQIKANEPEKAVLKKTSTVSAQKDGSKFFIDRNYNYQITIPESWALTEKQEAVPGIILQSKNSSVELWVGVEQPPIFSKEHQEAIEVTNKVKIKINSQEVQLTEYVYKAGNYLSSVIIKAKNAHPKVTLWLKGINKETYETAKGVVQSFKFL